MSRAVGIGLLILLAACGGGAERGDSAVAGADTGAMAGMGHMPGMGDSAHMAGMMGGGMMDSMQAHMRMMDTMSPDQLKAMHATRRPMMDSMLTRMDRDMQGWKMADARWTALIDSVRQDMTRMTSMSGQELKAFMAEHHARGTRLMQIHQDMMRMHK